MRKVQTATQITNEDKKTPKYAVYYKMLKANKSWAPEEQAVKPYPPGFVMTTIFVDTKYRTLHNRHTHVNY